MKMVTSKRSVLNKFTKVKPKLIEIKSVVSSSN